MKKDCYPIAVACVVASDNLSEQERLRYKTSSKEELKKMKPQLNAEKSCSVAQSALESIGIMVITLKNPSKQFLWAVIEELCKRNFPELCELFWFIFTGHGSHNCFYVKEKVYFSELIQLVSDIKVEQFIFFFECCQVDGEEITVADISGQHIAFYSSSPNRESYHYKGVGVLMSCMAEMLEAGYKESFHSFLQELHSRYLDRMVVVLKVPVHEREEFKKRNLAVQINTTFKDINLHLKAHEASRYNMHYTYVM